ncbi:MAG: hypothetical protein ABF292_06330 [Desulfobacterales bacterium]
MNSVVIDASVVLKWYLLDEILTDEKLHRAVKAGSGTAIRLGDLKIHDDNKIEWPDNGAPDD